MFAYRYSLRQPCFAPRRCPLLAASQQRRTVRTPLATPRNATKTQTYYDVLGVRQTASADEIKSAFRRQAKLVHPDVSKSVDSEDEFKRLKEAYDVLSDDEQRSEYDEALRQAARRGSSRGAGSSGRRQKVVIVQDDDDEGPSWMEVTFDMAGGDDDSDDDGDDDGDFSFGLDLDELEFINWASSGQNMRSSFQSSWQANGKKSRRGAAAKRSSAASEELTPEDKEELLRRLPRAARSVVQQVFGKKLQSLHSLQDLAEVLEAVEQLSDQGVEFEMVQDDDEDDDERGGAGRGARRTYGARRRATSPDGAAGGGGGGGGGRGGAGGRGRGGRGRGAGGVGASGRRRGRI